MQNLAEITQNDCTPGLQKWNAVLFGVCCFLQMVSFKVLSSFQDLFLSH